MKWQCIGCGEWFYGPNTSGQCGCTQTPKAQEPPADVSMLGMVVPAPEDLAGFTRDRLGQGHLRLRDAVSSFIGPVTGIFGRRHMGKIYGVHDSYCALVSPAGDGPGAPKFCTCDSGKKANFKIHREADHQIRAEAYADEFLGKLMDTYPENHPTKEQMERMRELLIATWKASHPLVEVVAAPVLTELPPAGPPTPAVPLELVQGGGDSGDGAALNATAHPFAAKSDAGKPKPFTFFMQQFPLGVKAVASHMEKGCSDPGHVFLGWADVENGFERYTDAMLRHLLGEIEETVTLIDHEEGYDREWAEEQHAIAVAANALIRLELLLRKRRNLNLDARPRA